MKRLNLFFLIIFFGITFQLVAEAKTSESELYKVGVGDQLSITVIGHQDLSVLTGVAVDGTIAFPHLGALYAKDKTLLEIEKEIMEKLAEGYIKYPVVSVSLVSSASKKIFINGEVNRIGVIPFEKDISVVKALSLAGGINDGGLYGKVKVRRKQGANSNYKAVIESYLDNGDITESETEDFLLQPDDILIVERSKTFFIQGRVNKVGEHILETDMTVSRALTLAGGVTEGGLHGKVKIRRKRKEGSAYYDVIESSLNKGIIKSMEAEDFSLQPEDILIVEQSDSVFIEGEVARPAQYVLEDGMTVSRAIIVAGGIAEGGLYGKVRLRRKRKDKPGYNDIEINLKGIIEGSVKEDLLLQPDDILIVERSKTFLLYGEVNRVGEFPLEHDMTVFRALTIAGGFNKWGSESRVKILRPVNDRKEFKIIKINIRDVLDGDATADVALEPGDIVVVSSGLF